MSVVAQLEVTPRGVCPSIIGPKFDPKLSKMLFFLVFLRKLSKLPKMSLWMFWVQQSSLLCRFFLLQCLLPDLRDLPPCRLPNTQLHLHSPYFNAWSSFPIVPFIPVFFIIFFCIISLLFFLKKWINIKVQQLTGSHQMLFVHCYGWFGQDGMRFCRRLCRPGRELPGKGRDYQQNQRAQGYGGRYYQDFREKWFFYLGREMYSDIVVTFSSTQIFCSIVGWYAF